MKCRSCGEEIREDARFCGFCGAAQTVIEEEQPVAEEPISDVPALIPGESAPETIMEEAPLTEIPELEVAVPAEPEVQEEEVAAAEPMAEPVAEPVAESIPAPVVAPVQSVPVAQPQYQQPIQPQYQPPQPVYQAPQTQYQPPQPVYQAPQPQYQPPQPVYQAPQPQYQPPQPVYQAPQPQYQPPQPVYQAPQHQYQPARPAYQPPQPQYQPKPAAHQRPAFQLPTRRGLGKMFWLGLLTLGIYPMVIMSRIPEEMNMVASRYDGRRTQQYLWVSMLTVLTFGIYALVWVHNLCDRMGNELKRRRIDYKFDAATFWLWNVLGSLIIVGPFIYTHKMMKAMNLINRDYNEKG